MKPTTLTPGRLLIVMFTLFISIGLISWDKKQTQGQYEQTVTDTTPKKKSVDKEKKVRDLDDVLDELNNVDFKLNMEKMQTDFAEAMKGFDLNKMQKEWHESMDKINWDKIKTDMAQAMKEIDMAKIQKEVQESMAKVDWDKMKNVEIKKFQDDMEKVQQEMKEMGPKIQKEMEKAKIEIEKAKVEIKEYKTFVDGLDNDGLINKKNSYSLKHADGVLYINGEKASDKTYNKYRHFLEQHKNFNIKKNGDDFNIDKD